MAAVGLTIFTNGARVDRQRSGVGKHNKPEARAKLILHKIQEEFVEINIFFSSQITFAEAWLTNIHSKDYLSFLEGAFDSFSLSHDSDWTDESTGLIPNHFYRKPLSNNVPLYKKSGYFGSDMMTPIFEDSYRNALLAASQAYRAAGHVATNGGIAYALTCSPGHHAKFDQYGGYCFINNATVAAFYLHEKFNKSIAILDVDYHHGSTSIVEELVAKKANFPLFAASIHGNPVDEYPSFEGYEDDNTKNTYNIPLPGGTTWEKYEEALKWAAEFLSDQRSLGALVIAFGADTYFDDPDVSPANRFALKEEDYFKMGCLIRKLFSNLPIVVTQEGGYNIDKVPTLACNFLRGLTN